MDSSGNAAVSGAGSPQKSGYSDYWSANNVYDLAGNYYDWTQEACYANFRVSRGGYYGYFGSKIPASHSNAFAPFYSGNYISSRPAMYMK